MLKKSLERIDRDGRLVPRVPLSLLINATGPKAFKSLSAIKQQLRARPGTPLFDDYPFECTIARYVGPAPAKCNNVTINGGKRIRVEWGAEHIILPSIEDEQPLGGMLAALGITSNEIQGFNLYDVRPRFVLLDDLDDRDSLASKDGGNVAAKTETNIDENVAGLGGPGQPLSLVMLCTIPSVKSIAYKYSDPKQKPSWSGIRLRKIKKWPDRRDLWEEYIQLRQKGKQTFDPATGRPTDPHGREAHTFLVAHFEAMHAGAEVSNDNDFIVDLLPGGSQSQLSALQNCYDYIADNGMDSFLTEYQNDPPLEEGFERLVLTAYHIQNNCGSGLEKRVIPDGTASLTLGADMQKLGMHFVSLASNEHAVGCIADYDFFEFMTEGKKAADCEARILEGLFRWYEAQEQIAYVTQSGEEVLPDLCLIDMGWKEESWNTQPVQVFCAQVGFEHFMPSKGIPNYRRPKDSTRQAIVGDNWHIAWPGGVPIVEMNSDHWKLKVHEGFLAARGEPGSLTLFDLPRIDGRRSRTGHLSFSKHILAESWETRAMPGFRGHRTGWWKSAKPNHYFDALYAAIVGRSMRGISTISMPELPSAPAPSAELAEAGETYGRDRGW